MPDGLRDRIADAAAGNHRSMNAEIVARLEASLEGEPAMSAAEVQKLIFGGEHHEGDVERAPAPYDLLVHELKQAAASAIEARLAQLTHDGLAPMFFDVKNADHNPRLFYKPPKAPKK